MLNIPQHFQLSRSAITAAAGLPPADPLTPLHPAWLRRSLLEARIRRPRSSRPTTSTVCPLVSSHAATSVFTSRGYDLV